MKTIQKINCTQREIIMKKTILLIIFGLFLNVMNCANRVDPVIEKAKRSCNIKFITDQLVPDVTVLLASATTGSSSGGTTTGTTAAVTITHPSSSATFNSPQFISAINENGSTITGTINDDATVHVFAFKGLTTYEQWVLKFNSNTTTVCKAGTLLAGVNSDDSINYKQLSVSITTSANILLAGTSANSFIVCTSANNALVTGTTSTASSSSTYSIDLRKDLSSAGSTGSLLSNLQAAQKQVKNITSSLNYAKCMNDAERIGDIKDFMLF